MDSVGIENTSTRDRVKMIGDSLGTGMEAITERTKDISCLGVTGRVINLLQVIAGEAMPAEASTVVRERIARAAALNPKACLADFIVHLSDVASLSTFLARINDNILQGSDISAFFSGTATDSRMH